MQSIRKHHNFKLFISHFFVGYFICVEYVMEKYTALSIERHLFFVCFVGKMVCSWSNSIENEFSSLSEFIVASVEVVDVCDALSM